MNHRQIAGGNSGKQSGNPMTVPSDIPEATGRGTPSVRQQIHIRKKPARLGATTLRDQAHVYEARFPHDQEGPRVAAEAFRPMTANGRRFVCDSDA